VLRRTLVPLLLNVVVPLVALLSAMLLAALFLRADGPPEKWLVALEVALGAGAAVFAAILGSRAARRAVRESSKGRGPRDALREQERSKEDNVR